VKRYSTISSTSYIASNARLSKDIIMGDYSYVGPNCIIYKNVKIGKYSMVANNVSIIGQDHIWDKTNLPIIFSGRPQNYKSTVIGNDVWIGAHSKIRTGVKIGDGAIIAMGSIVVKDVPPYSIVGGNPAKLIKKRFSPAQIKEHKKMLESNIINPHKLLSGKLNEF
jgi:acetyltransferase-like isoleucine patch superfamily enzyme